MGQGSNAFYYVFPAVLSLITLMGYKKKSTGYIILLILLFFSMFRGDHVGNDTLNYMSDSSIQYRGGSLEFEVSSDYISSNFGSNTEFLDILLHRLVYRLNLSPRVIIYFYSLITLILLYFALKRFKVNTSIGLLVYVLIGLYYFSLTAARQMTAVSIVLWGMQYMIKNGKNHNLKLHVKQPPLQKYQNLINFSGSILIASMIHASAIFYIVIYPLKYIRINRKIISFCLISLSLICVLLSFNIMNIIFRLFDMEYVARYMGLFDEGGRGFMGRLFDLIRFAIYIYLFIYCTKRKNTNTYDMLYATAIILLALFVQSNGLLARITYYLTVFICIYIPYSLLKNGKMYYNDKFTLLIFYLIICIYGAGSWAISSLTSGYYLMF